MKILVIDARKRSQTRDVGPLSTRAEIASVDADKRTAEVMFSTGARVLRQSYWDGPSYEELSMEAAHVRMSRLQSGTAPLLTDHRVGVDNIVGVIESARLQGKTGYATVRFPKVGVDARADQLFEKVKDGIVRSVSVGYRTYRTEKVGVEGEAKIPVFRVTDWEPHEISAVALPAEVGAGFRSEEQSNPCVFVTRDEESEVDEDEKKRAEEAAEAQKVEHAKRDAEMKKADDEKTRQAERERIKGIQHAARAIGGDQTAFITDHTNKGTDIAKVRELVLEQLAKRSDDSAINTNRGSGLEVGEEARDKMIRGMSAGLLARAGALPVLAAVVAGVKAGKIMTPGVRHEFKNFDADDNGGEFRDFTLYELARECLELRGVKTRGWSRERIVGEAFTYRSGGEATISDFAVILENVMYKQLLGAYTQAADSWRAFCGTDSVQDFRASNRYRTGSFGTLDTLSETGEYKSKSIPDGLKFSITTETRGNKISVSRQAIINDDMGAISDTMNKFGRMAGLSIEVDVYNLLTSGSGLGPNITLGGTTARLFDDTAWANVSTGAALTMAALEADRVKMAQQKDISNNEYLNLRPSVLLVPLSLEGEANVLNRAKFDPTASSAFERPNIVGGLFSQIIGSPRLTGTRRYLFVNPGDVAAIKVVFLNGAQAPFMDQRLGWDVDGTEMKLRMDFKVQAFDPKGALTNAGA